MLSWQIISSPRVQLLSLTLAYNSIHLWRSESSKHDHKAHKLHFLLAPLPEAGPQTQKILRPRENSKHEGNRQLLLGQDLPTTFANQIPCHQPF